MPLSDEEVMAKLQQISTQDVATAAAMESQSGTANAPGSMDQAHAAFMRNMGAQEGVPFHSEGLPVGMDLGVKFRKGEDQLRYLVGKVGANNIRLNAYQEPVVRIVNPDTGQPEDYPVNPRQLTPRSVTGLIAETPEMAATGAALYATGGTGLLARSLMGAAGTETGRALKEMGTQLMDAGPGGVRVAKDIEEAASQLPIDFFSNLILGGTVKAGQTMSRLVRGQPLPNPIANTFLFQPANPAVTTGGVEAANRLAAKSGIAPALTPAEATGIPWVAQAETYAGARAAGASPVSAMLQRREAASRAIQDWMVDPATLQTDEEVGRRGLSVLAGPVRAIQQQIESLKGKIAMSGIGDEASLMLARDRTIAQQQLDLVNRLGASRIPVEGVAKLEMGDALQSSALSMREASQKHVSDLYDEVFSNPVANLPFIQATKLKGDIDTFLGGLPKVTKTVNQQIGDLVTETGQPITVPRLQQVPIDTPVRARLEELSTKLSGKDAALSLNDLKQVRTDVGNAITQGEAVPGTDTGRLKKLYGTISGAIENGLDDIGDPQLKQAWSVAVDAARAHSEKFSEKTVAAFFREAEQAGSLGKAAFVDKLIKNPDAYDAAKAFFGPNSPEMSSFIKTAKDDLLEKSLGTGDAIDGAKFTRALRALRSDNPKLFADALGGNGRSLMSQAEMLGAFQKNLPIEELSKLLNQRNPIANNALLELQFAEQKLSESFQNQVTKRFLSGSIGAEQIEPEKFVRFLPSAKLSDVRSVMTQLHNADPDIADQVQRKAIQSLVNEAKRYPSTADTLASLKGEPGKIVDAAGLESALGGAEEREKWKAILGTKYDDLIDYAKMELLRGQKQALGGGAGMFAKAGDAHAVMDALTGGGGKGSLVKEGSGFVRAKIFSILISNPKVGNILLSPQRLTDAPTWIKSVMTSEPMVRALVEELGSPGAAYKALTQLRPAWEGGGAMGGTMTDADLQQRLQTMGTQP